MVKTGQTWSGLVVTKDATGALATPSVGPAGVLYVDGTANGATVTVTGSNPYKWTVTLPSLTAGQCVSMYITATIATIATASVVAEDVADTVLVSEVNTALATVDGIVDDLLAVAPDNKPTVAATGEASANVTMQAGVLIPGPLALEATAQAILDDTGTTLPGLISAGGGTGLYSETITVNDLDGSPVDGVLVQVATESGFANIVRSGTTNNLGQVTLHFDAAGTYYGRAEIAGYGLATFTVEVTA